MKLFRASRLLGGLSILVLIALTESWSPLVKTSLGMQRLIIIFLSILPAGIGTILAVMSWNRREIRGWWAIGNAVADFLLVLAGILLLLSRG
jgi:uncharacterized membrane protein SirB2